MTHNTDPHPDTFTHHEFLVSNILKSDGTHSADAMSLALEVQKCSAEHTYDFLIPDNLEDPIYRN